MRNLLVLPSSPGFRLDAHGNPVGHHEATWHAGKIVYEWVNELPDFPFFGHEGFLQDLTAIATEAYVVKLKELQGIK